jgi:hypothetical protein
MSLRHITVDHHARILEITNMFDMFGKDTLDPGIATACVVRLPDGQWWSADTDDVPIYTVH